MATYKVIQDIEAEDKFVGPLTLKQFIFFMAGGLFSYLSFFVASQGLMFALALTVPPALFGFFMAIPWSKNQPTDVWVLAKIRFRLKPKQRIWDQAGMQDLVTITVPKKEEKQLTKNLSQTEVKSRLKALAETIDSRGWAIKHAEFQQATPDRLLDVASQAQQVPDNEPAPDILEEQPKIDNLIERSEAAHKEQLYEKMDRIRQGESLSTVDAPEPLVAPPSDSILDEQVLSAQLKAKRTAGDIGQNNLHTIPAKPVSSASTDDTQQTEDADVSTTEVKKAQASVTEQSSPDILELAQNNDLNVSTIARQAKSKDKQNDATEVVISLH